MTKLIIENMRHIILRLFFVIIFILVHDIRSEYTSQYESTKHRQEAEIEKIEELRKTLDRIDRRLLKEGCLLIDKPQGDNNINVNIK